MGVRLFLIVGLAVGLCSCASVTVVNEVPLSEPAPGRLPMTILVQPFEFDEGNIRVDREGQELTDFKRSLQQDMTKNLAERLRKYVAPAQGLPTEAGIPHGDYWLVTGRFTRVNQGSRFLRSAFGFGSGGTKMDVTVKVAALSEEAIRPFLLIQTSGGSNAMPGAILGVINWTMILNGGEGLIAGVTGDTRRSSREIVAGLCDYLKQNGVPVAKDAPKPKIKGKPNWWPEKKTDQQVPQTSQTGA
jgi:hypothetical protein